MIISIFDPHVKGVEPIISIVEWNIYYENHKELLNVNEMRFPCTDMTHQYIYVGY